DLVKDLDSKRMPFAQLDRALLAQLPDVSLGLGADLLGVAAFGLVGPLAPLVIEAKLQGMIAVALLGPNLEHRTGPAFQDGHGHTRSVFPENLGHADFSPQQTDLHRTAPLDSETLDREGRRHEPRRTSRRSGGFPCLTWSW